MDSEQTKVLKPKKSQKKKKTEESLPPCTHAASAEHAGAHHEDGPCDDGREGKIKGKPV